jgi:hypothetical protein
VILVATVVVTIVLLVIFGLVAGWSYCEHLHQDEDARVRAAALRAAQEIGGITLAARQEMHRIVAEEQRRSG